MFTIGNCNGSKGSRNRPCNSNSWVNSRSDWTITLLAVTIPLFLLHLLFMWIFWKTYISADSKFSCGNIRGVLWKLLNNCGFIFSIIFVTDRYILISIPVVKSIKRNIPATIQECQYCQRCYRLLLLTNGGLPTGGSVYWDDRPTGGGAASWEPPR